MSTPPPSSRPAGFRPDRSTFLAAAAGCVVGGALGALAGLEPLWTALGGGAVFEVAWERRRRTQAHDHGP